jgi:hypothetical protein
MLSVMGLVFVCVAGMGLSFRVWSALAVSMLARSAANASDFG